MRLSLFPTGCRRAIPRCCFGHGGAVTRLFHVSGGLKPGEQSRFAGGARSHRCGDFSVQECETLTQFHRHPGAMSCLLRCEGRPHPCFGICLSPDASECSYVLEFLM